MANQIENRIAAWCSMFQIGNPVSYQWKGQGIVSVTRNGLGEYDVVFEDGINTDTHAFFLSPSGLQSQQPATPDPIQSCYQRLPGDQSVRCIFSLGDDSTTRVDPAGFSLEVITGNAELPEQAVA